MDGTEPTRKASRAWAAGTATGVVGTIERWRRERGKAKCTQRTGERKASPRLHRERSSRREDGTCRHLVESVSRTLQGVKIGVDGGVDGGGTRGRKNGEEAREEELDQLPKAP